MRSDNSGNLKPIIDMFLNGCIAVSLLMIASGILAHVIIRMKNNCCTAVWVLMILFTYIMITVLNAPALLIWNVSEREIKMFCDEDFTEVPSGMALNYVRAASSLVKDLDGTLRQHEHMCKPNCPCPEIDLAKWNRKSQEKFNSGEYQFDGNTQNYEECLLKMKLNKVEDEVEI